MDVEHTEEGEVTFDNFLKAVHTSKNCNKSRMKKLQTMSSDKIFAMDTLLSQERRRMLLKGIIDDAVTRQRDVDAMLLQSDADIEQRHLLSRDGTRQNISGTKLNKKQAKDIESILREHENQVSDHNDFVGALEAVMTEKFRLLKHRNDHVQGHNKRRQKVVAGFNFSNNNQDDDNE